MHNDVWGCAEILPASLLTKYEADWQHVGSHFQGIDEISLSSLTRVRVIRRGVSYNSLSPSIISYKTGILYAVPKSHRILRWKKNSNEVDVFAGTGSAGNMDGMATRVLSASSSLSSIA